MSALDQLKTMTQVVADTGDFESIEKYRPQDATTNPSLITAAAQMPQYQGLVQDALRQVVRLHGTATFEDKVEYAVDLLFVLFGLKILGVIPGRVSTEVDARLSYDTDKTVSKARHLIALYEQQGIPRERVLIKIASTWEGIQAAGILEKEGIHCNLTLLFNLAQAIACGNANVTLISPFVGRILDWYKKETGVTAYLPHEDPGVISVTSIYHYYKKFGIQTLVMGASFRNIDEILQLAGCDLLTISPSLLTELQASDQVVTRKLDPTLSQSMPIERVEVDRATFDRMLAADRMSSEKLSEGIAGFTKSLETLEHILASQLKQMLLPAQLTEATEYCSDVRCAEYRPCVAHEGKGHSNMNTETGAEKAKRLGHLKAELMRSVGQMGELHEQLLAFQAAAQGEMQDFMQTLSTVIQEQAKGTPLKEIKSRLAERAEVAVQNVHEKAPVFEV